MIDAGARIRFHSRRQREVNCDLCAVQRLGAIVSQRHANRAYTCELASVIAERRVAWLGHGADQLQIIRLGQTRKNGFAHAGGRMHRELRPSASSSPHFLEERLHAVEPRARPRAVAIAAGLNRSVELLEQRLLLVRKLYRRLDLNAAEQITNT